MPKTNHFSARRIATDALLIALCFALGMLSLSNWAVEISARTLPVFLAALLFGAGDGWIVGSLGALLEQMLRYGLALNTVFWILPAAVCGVLVGLFRRSFEKTGWLPRILLFLAVGVAYSLLNTAAFFADWKLFGYYPDDAGYQYTVINGVWRLLKDGIVTPVLGLLSIEIAKRLRRTGLVRQEGSV